MRVKVFNLGCKVNGYESDELIHALRERGYQASEGIGEADIYILNTCAVTNEAERKSRQAVTRLLKNNSEAKVFVCGCASQHNAEQFSLIKGVEVVKGVANKIALVDYIDKKLSEAVIDVERLPLIYENNCGASVEKTRATIKICDGCNRFCSYCIVPYLRGRLRSRNKEDILSEFYGLKGVNEVVFTGVDISAYGSDTGSNLVGLIRELKSEGIRKRLGSLEVGVISRELLEAMQADGCWCDHFHLSLQSGSDGVLKKMNRHYTTAEFLKKIELIREYYPDAGITTDIIAGFPEETDEQHNETLSFVREAGFTDIHPFEYSLRQGTLAAKMEQVEPRVKKKRVEELCAVKNEIKSDFLSKHIGQDLEVLTETEGGYTSNYMKVYFDKKEEAGKFVKVKSVKLFKDGLLAERK